MAEKMLYLFLSIYFKMKKCYRNFRKIIVFIILTVVLSCLYSCLNITKSTNKLEKKLIQDFKDIIINN